MENVSTDMLCWFRLLYSLAQGDDDNVISVKVPRCDLSVSQRISALNMEKDTMTIDSLNGVQIELH